LLLCLLEQRQTEHDGDAFEHTDGNGPAWVLTEPAYRGYCLIDPKEDIERVLAWTTEGAWERFAGPVTRLTRLIPAEALVGYHLCYGTFPEWPMYEARDMDLLVRMANFAVANSGRTVDWLHLAGPRYLRSEDRSFFRPLVDLEPLDARVFLGIVLPIDGAAGLRRRVDTASRYISDFGVAMYCGFGRQPGKDGTETMREHAEVVTAVRGLR